VKRRSILRAEWPALALHGRARLFLALLVGGLEAAGCPEPPLNDCAAKAMCSSPDSATEPPPAWDASVDAGNADASVDAGTDASDDASAPVEEPTPCPLGTSHVCVPAVPPDFMGPIVVWNGSPNAAPDCPSGYPRAYDTYSDLDAGDAACACSCEATGQQCVAEATVFSDKNCMTVCAQNVSVESCSSFSGCINEQGTLRANAPAPEEGTCVAQMTEVNIPRATWSNATRMCNSQTTAGDPNFYCEDAGTICVPIPEAPYATTPCVAQIVQDGEPIPTSCPAGYPHGPVTSYWSYNSFNDTRDCAPCTCSPTPAGGSCTGTLTVTSVDQGDCTTDAMSYPLDTLGSGCVEFDLSDSIGNIGATYSLTPGTCSITTNTAPMGTVTPIGEAQIICCM
jgi:hypothetical protein